MPSRVSLRFISEHLGAGRQTRPSGDELGREGPATPLLKPELPDGGEV